MLPPPPKIDRNRAHRAALAPDGYLEAYANAAKVRVTNMGLEARLRAVVHGRPPGITARHLLTHSAGLGNPIPVRWIHPIHAPAVDQNSFLDRLLAKHGRLR